MPYSLPNLPYDFEALEPHISGKIIELHHGKHHKAYVDGANKALEQLAEARSQRDFAKLSQLERALAFNLSGHVLHSLYWQNLTPKAAARPSGKLAAAIDRDFGNFDSFKEQMTQTATTIMGSGWAALEWDPLGERLLTTQIHDHQSETTQGSSPLMVLDAWEHAYYLQYGPAKADYFKAIWNLWNWDDISRRFEQAQKIDLTLLNAANGQPHPADVIQMPQRTSGSH